METRKPKRTRTKAASKVETPEPTATAVDVQVYQPFCSETELPEELTFRFLNRKSYQEAYRLYQDLYNAYQVIWKKLQQERLAALQPMKPDRLTEVGLKQYEAEYQDLWSLRWKLKNDRFNVLEFKKEINAQLTPRCGWTVEEIINYRR